MSEEKFLSRWSRLKAESRQVETGSPAEDSPPAAPRSAEGRSASSAIEAPLPSLDELRGLVSEYSRFLKPGVDDNLRRAALKKLFLDPHFNTMDGLDVYIDDYSKAEPIPEEMLKTLAHARDLLFKDAESAKQGSPNAQTSPADVESPQAPEPEKSSTPAPDDARTEGAQADGVQGG